MYIFIQGSYIQIVKLIRTFGFIRCPVDSLLEQSVTTNELSFDNQPGKHWLNNHAYSVQLIYFITQIVDSIDRFCQQMH